MTDVPQQRTATDLQSHFHNQNMDIKDARDVLAINDSHLATSKFTNVNLEHSAFDDINLNQSTFINTNLSECTFENVNLTNVAIANANLTGMTVNGVSLYAMMQAYELHSAKSQQSTGQ